MKRNNLFDGNSDFAAFAQVSYKLLMTREWVTYKSIMDVCYPKDKLNSVSSGTAYGELKKAFPAVRKSIQEKLEKLSAATKMAGDAKKALDEQEEARKRSDEILKDKTRAIIEMSHSLDGDIAAVTEETRKYEISLDEQRRLLEENNQVISEIDTIIANSRSITRR